MADGNSLADIRRRALLWTVLCSVSAAPSFIFAAASFSKLAMFVGVALFIVLYTISTSTPAFLRFRARPFVRRTLYIGYGTRVVIAIVFPVGMALDLFPGLFSTAVVGQIFHGRPVGFGPGVETGFVPTLLITIVQGSILNLLLSIYMAMVWTIQAVACKWPNDSRGFPVELK